jgi:hypothetical protein
MAVIFKDALTAPIQAVEQNSVVLVRQRMACVDVSLGDWGVHSNAARIPPAFHQFPGSIYLRMYLESWGYRSLPRETA